jgi:aromatic ring-opening dioxygenase LigB subunit
MAINMMCVVPHGTIAIQNLNYGIDTARTIFGFQEIAQIIDEKNIEHFIVIDPHDKINRSKFTLFKAKKYIGNFANRSSRISSEYRADEKLNLSLEKCLQDNNCIISQENVHKISWGALVPLYMLSNNQTVSVMSIDRNIPTNIIQNIGNNIHQFCCDYPKNICIVFSCDLSHSHSKKYTKFPYHKDSQVYDDYVQNLISTSNIEDYVNVDMSVVRNVNTDAHAQLTMLSGVCNKINYRSKLLSYEVPTYFGMATGIIL